MLLRRLALVAATAAFGTLSGATATVHAQDGPVVQTVRFYRAEHRQTRCKAFVAIPYALLAPAAGSPGMQHLSYQVEVRIADSMGLTLHEETWSGRAPVSVGMKQAYALEVLEFPLAPGRYQLEVAVTDSVTGRRFVTQASLEAFSTKPVASDLLLSPEMRLVTEADSVPAAGQIRLGNTLVTPSVELVLTPLRTKAYYLLEAYAEQEASGTMAVAVMTETGQVVVRTPPTTVGVPSGGGVLKGQMDLAGLPEGSYQMRVSLTLGDQAVERTLPFRMQGMHAALVADSVRRGAERVGDVGYFAAMGEGHGRGGVGCCQGAVGLHRGVEGQLEDLQGSVAPGEAEVPGGILAAARSHNRNGQERGPRAVLCSDRLRQPILHRAGTPRARGMADRPGTDLCKARHSRGQSVAHPLGESATVHGVAIHQRQRSILHLRGPYGAGELSVDAQQRPQGGFAGWLA